MRKSWWKILGVVLLTYTFIAGLLVPLKPGIYTVTPGYAESGTLLHLQVEGYNTQYAKESDKIRVWLKMSDDKALLAKQVEVEDDTHLTAIFSVPQSLPIEKKIIKGAGTGKGKGNGKGWPPLG